MRFFFQTALLLFFSFGLAEAASLEAPAVVFPSADNSLWAGAIDFQWTNTGADYYQYHINLPDGKSREEVLSLGSNSRKIYDLAPGEYSWAVRSCRDKEARNCGSWSSVGSFKIVSAPSEVSGGLIPCGRSFDDPRTTGVNESKPCGIPDVFLLLKMILDFVLWRLGLIVLGLLAVATGVLHYFATWNPKAVEKVKPLWRSAVIGYLILFGAWVFVGWILSVLGYQVGIFGSWWKISF